MKTLTSFVCCVMLSFPLVVRGQSPVPAPGEPIHPVSPKYPKDARKQKVEGTVALHVTIAADGSVKDVAVVNGDARLTSAAVDAVKKWRFQPFSADDKPVEGQRDVTVNFKLAEPADTETRLDDSTDPIAKKGSAGVTRPQIIHSPDPEYTKAALDAHVDGLLALSLVVGSDGKPRDIKVARSLGYGLDETGIEAVRQWRFKPATQDGKPVAVSIVVEVPFRR